MNDVNKAIAEVISRLRNNADLSQEDLADKSGIHRTYVSQIERGLKSPTLQVLMRLASALNTSGSQIIKEMELSLDKLQNER